MTTRVLISYWYFAAQRGRDVDLDRLFDGLDVDVFADSGGFTASTVGATLSARGYARWLRRWSHLITVAATLDVVGDAPQTWRNTCELRALDADVISAFHVNEPFDWLDRYVEAEPYVALGGMVPYARTQRALGRWMAACYRRRSEGCGFHGFGLNAPSLMRLFPWYSVDASSWSQGLRFGNLTVFDATRGRWVKRDRVVPAHTTSTGTSGRLRAALFDPEVHDALQSLQFSPSRVFDELTHGWHRSRAMQMSMALRSYRAAERTQRQRFGETTAGARGGGPRVYLAIDPSWAREFVRVARLEQERTRDRSCGDVAAEDRRSGPDRGGRDVDLARPRARVEDGGDGEHTAARR